MNYLILIVSSFFTLTAMACPNLSGTYQCQFSSQMTGQLEIGQTVIDDVKVYTINDEIFYADDTVRMLPDTDDMAHQISRSSCDTGNLIVYSTAQILDAGNPIGQMHVYRKWTVQGDTLKVEQTGELSLLFDQENSISLDEAYTCNKM